MEIDGRAVDVAALEIHGAAVSRSATLRRGLVVVGRRLRAELRSDRSRGRRARQLNDTECRALAAAEEADRR